MARQLWSEKYRPHSIDDYVWRDELLRNKCLMWIRDRAVPHIIFSGEPGTGKTSLAYLLLEQIGIPESDILYIPASRDNKTDDLIDRIQRFTTVWADNDTDMRYVILDEADSITWQAQGRLRADMDIYTNTRFILTANFEDKLISPIKSRCEHYRFKQLDHDQFTMRLIAVMQAERLGVESIDNIQIMSDIVDRCYPDLRRSIGMLQKCTLERSDGARYLSPPSSEDANTDKPYMFVAADQFAAGNFREARSVIVRNVSSNEDFVEAFRWLYQNLHLFGTAEDTMYQVLLAIRKGLVAHSTVAIPEINLSATLCEISMIAKNENCAG